MAFESRFLKSVPAEETLRVNRSKGQATCTCRRFTFTDKDTGAIVTLIPALDISGYGDTEKEAKEMLDRSLEFYFDSLLSISAAEMEKELIKGGWKRKQLKHKEFSKAYVDTKGNLNGFNVEADKIKVEMETISI